jgi:hypothetical protein
LAAAGHLARWLGRLDHDGAALLQIAIDKQWPADREATVAAARAIYLRLPDGYKLWHMGREFVVAEPARLSQILAAAY